MRSWWAGVAAVAVGCGGHQAQQPPAENTSPQQIVLAIHVAGEGTVRGQGIECRGDCTQRFAKGTKLSLTATADSGASFDGFSGACSGQACDLSLDADASVSAVFTRPPPPPVRHALTVLVDGHGSVRSTPSGIDCGATCSARYDEGTQVSLAPVPDAGYAFSGWSGVCNGAGGCVVMMSSDAHVSARFDALPPQMFSVTVSVTGPGRISGNGIDCPGSACSAQVAAGTVLSLNAVANGGARMMGWAGACAASGATCSMTVTQNVSASAKFENEVLMLAGADGTNSNAIAINSTSVFYARYGNNVYGLWSVPKAGGTPMLVNSNGCCFNAIVADGHRLRRDVLGKLPTRFDGELDRRRGGRCCLCWMVGSMHGNGIHVLGHDVSGSSPAALPAAQPRRWSRPTRIRAAPSRSIRRTCGGPINTASDACRAMAARATCRSSAAHACRWQ
ncbi:MAG: hypothetical protein E6J88_12750 [Deltaproteobacteria bacterium]|nr:MAG: hypothetical protein E6J88_12750 [Deltaproteobacteria bacterium]